MFYYHLTNNKLQKNKFLYKQELDFKPRGLWFAKKNLWNKFLKSQNMNRKYKYEYKLKINFDNILVLSNFDEIINFGKKYGKFIKYNSKKYLVINWKKVEKDYDGIYYNNYNKIKEKILNKSKTYRNRISKYAWFLTVDLESGCLFNNKSIVKSTLI